MIVLLQQIINKDGSFEYKDESGNSYPTLEAASTTLNAQCCTKDVFEALVKLTSQSREDAIYTNNILKNILESSGSEQDVNVTVESPDVIVNPNVDINTPQAIEIYRLSASENSASENLMADSAGEIGNIVSIASGYKSVSFHVLPTTVIDESLTTFQGFTINDIEYTLVKGDQFLPELPYFSSDNGIITQPLEIRAIGNADIEVIVLR